MLDKLEGIIQNIIIRKTFCGRLGLKTPKTHVLTHRQVKTIYFTF